MSFKSVLLGTSAHKNYTHNMSFDNNTTMDFGFLQPLLSQYMLPNSSISVNSKQLVRLAPMPTPSFARMYLQNFSRFVKMTDVVPYYESLLSGISFTTSSGQSVKPTQMPVTTNSFLLWNLLVLSRCSVYEKYSLVGIGDDFAYKPLDVVGSLEDKFKYMLQNRFGFVDTDWTYKPEFTTAKYSLSPLQSDYTILYSDSESKKDYMFCFQFSARAKRLRKAFLGLGYSLNGEDNKLVSIAPLLAYYKAYYDYFGLTRDVHFANSL